MTVNEIENARNTVLDGPSQPTDSTKSVDVLDSIKKLKRDIDTPFEEREVLMFSDGTNTGGLFSPSSKVEEEGESRTGPSSEVSSRITTIVATTTTELITTETVVPSMDKRQDGDDSSPSDTATELKKRRSISKVLLGSLKGKLAKKKQKHDIDNKASLIIEIDDEIELVREGLLDSDNNNDSKSSDNHHKLVVQLDDEIMQVREGSPDEISRVPPPLTSIYLSRSEDDDLLGDLDDEIFQVREGKPKSALKKATTAAAKTVRFAFGPATKGEDSEFGRKLDINTLLMDSDDEEDDDDVEQENSIITNESAEATIDFLNDLQKQSMEFEFADGFDGNSVESYESNETTSTDGQSVTMYDCWELACT